jgi:hypothetical protein
LCLHCVRALSLGVLLSTLWACEGWGSKPFGPEPAPPPKAPDDADVLRRGTVGAETLVSNLESQPLRGFGLVVGLNGKGGGDCPAVIREYLVDFLIKQVGPQGASERKKTPAPGELIDSHDTAVVEVTGLVPSGARKGGRFDLQVKALAGTSAQSLEGGLLLPTELRYFDRSASGQGLVMGAVLAEGGGPLFVNPFGEDGAAATQTNPRAGAVLGGGRVVDEHPTRLMLIRPNFQLAQNIERRVNERFGQKPKSAEAQSVGYIDLFTPPAFARQPERFRQLVSQLYVDNRPAVAEQRLRELSQSALAGGVNLERAAATWESAGRSALPFVQPLYSQSDAGLRFYAARTGSRLGDLGALPILTGLATSGSHGLRLLAVRELGSVDSPQAGVYLAPLLNDPDQELRIAAYEALLARSHPAIRSLTFGHVLDPSQINFVLDIIDSSGPPMIYVRRTRLPRLAVFGSRTPVTPPVFYANADDTVTIHTVEGSDDLRLFAKRHGKLSDELVLPPRVVDLISGLADLPQRDKGERLRGIGLPYSRVVKILAALSKDGAIAAKIVLEQTSLTELLGPDVSPDRPEAEVKSSD